jgi:phosphoribosylformylglycinamidine synthase subunit PurS
MKFTAHINIMPLKELLDPQGKAVHSSLHSLGLEHVSEVRIGKHITLQLEAKDETTARSMAEDACRRLLANPVMESFEVHLAQA